MRQIGISPDALSPDFIQKVEEVLQDCENVPSLPVTTLKEKDDMVRWVLQNTVTTTCRQVTRNLLLANPGELVGGGGSDEPVQQQQQQQSQQQQQDGDHDITSECVCFLDVFFLVNCVLLVLAHSVECR
jgi:hypothetical protein